MKRICSDIEFNGKVSSWFFEEGEYKRLENSKIVGHIRGENLPDPDELWKARCEEMGAIYPAISFMHPKTKREVRLKPTEATFKLFEHWQQEVRGNA